MENENNLVILETEEETPKSSSRASGIVNRGKNEFAYYPEEPIKFEGVEVDYFHFKKPTLKKAKANNVVLSNEMSARNIESLIRACLLRIAKKEGGEFHSIDYKRIIEELEMDVVTEITDGCSNFFVKVAE